MNEGQTQNNNKSEATSFFERTPKIDLETPTERLRHSQTGSETVTERAHRQYVSNLLRLGQAAEDRARHIIARLKLEDGPDIPPSASQPTPYEVARQKQLECLERNELSGVMRSLVRVQLRLKGIRQTDRLLGLVDYLQENLVDTLTTYPQVKPEQVERERARLVKQGYEVTRIYEADDNKVSLSAFKLAPYKFDIQTARFLNNLLETGADIPRLIEDLGRLGVVLGTGQFSYYDRDQLIATAQSAETVRLINLLAQANIKVTIGRIDPLRLDNFLESNFQELARNSQVIDKLSRIDSSHLRVIQAIGSVNLYELKDFLNLLDQPQLLILAATIKRRYALESVNIYEYVEALQQEGLADTIQYLITSGLTIDSDKLIPNRYRQKPEETIQQLKDFLQSPALQRLLTDPRFRDFTGKMNLLVQSNIAPGNIEVFDKLRRYPQCLPLAELFIRLSQDERYPSRLLNIIVGSHSNYFIQLLRNQSLIELIIDPSFEEFVLELKYLFDYRFSVEDIVTYNNNRPLLDFYQDREARTLLCNPEGAAVIKAFGSFDPDLYEGYCDLARVPMAAALLNKVNDYFGSSQSSNTYWTENVNTIAEQLTRLSEDQALQAKLFTPIARSVSKQLREQYQYQFLLRDTDEMVALLGDPSFQKQLFAPSTVSFIKDSKIYFQLSRARSLIYICNEAIQLHPLSVALAQEFNYQIPTAEIANLDKIQKLEKLDSNEALKAKLMEPRRIEFIKRLISQNDFGNYIFDPADAAWLIEAPLDLFDFLAWLKQEFDYRDRSYSYGATQDAVQRLSDLYSHKQELFDFAQRLKQNDLIFPLDIARIPNLLEALQTDYPKLIRYYAMFFYAEKAETLRKPQVVSLSILKDFAIFLSKNYQEQDFQALHRLMQKYYLEINENNTETLSHLIALYEHENEILDLAGALGEYGYQFKSVDASLLASILSERQAFLEFTQLIVSRDESKSSAGYSMVYFPLGHVYELYQHPERNQLIEFVSQVSESMKSTVLSILTQDVKSLMSLYDKKDGVLEILPSIVEMTRGRFNLVALDYLLQRADAVEIIDFAQELNPLGYHFDLLETDIIARLLPQRREFILFGQIMQQWLNVNWPPESLSSVIKLFELPDHELIIMTAAELQQYGYRFDFNDLQFLQRMQGKLDEVIDFVKQLTSISQPFDSLISLEYLLDHPNRQAIVDFAKEINVLNNEKFYLGTISTLNDLLAYRQQVLTALRALAEQGRTMLVGETLITLVQQPDYETILGAYLVIDKTRRQPLTSLELPLYRAAAQIENLPTVLEQLSNQQKIYSTEQFAVFIGCQGSERLMDEVYNTIKDPYFTETRDANSQIIKFRQQLTKGQVPPNVFVKTLTLSKDPRATRKLFAKIGLLAELTKEEQTDYSSFLATEEFREAYNAVNRLYIERALTVLFNNLSPGQRQELQITVEKTLAIDPTFENDFEAMTSSVGIYTQKYPGENNQVTRTKLFNAIRQALELDLIRDPAQYHLERFRRSEEELDRLFSLVPNVNRQTIENFWLDLSTVRPDLLDATSLEEKTLLKNKLLEVRLTLQTEILPDLSVLFRAKLDKLRELAATEDKKADLYRARLGILETYLINPEGETRADIVTVYRRLMRDIASEEKRLTTGETKPHDKRRIGMELGIRRSLRDILKALYKLSVIDPDRIDRKVDYINEVDEAIQLMTNNLDKLAIVDKEKQPGQDQNDDIEIDLQTHLQHLSDVITAENRREPLRIVSQFVTDFNSLARCPELTSSCQRLTEVTSYNESAYSRILDGINELLDIYQVETRQGPRGVEQQKRRVARCFAELSAIKRNRSQQDAGPELAVLLDRLYIDPEQTGFANQICENMLKLTLQRLRKEPTIRLILSLHQFHGYREIIDRVASQFGYKVNDQSGMQYFVNRSRLAFQRGKYYDSFGGHNSTEDAHFTVPQGGLMLIEKI